MKQLLILLAVLASSFIVKAQASDFEKEVEFIRQKVRCCSSNFSASVHRRVDSISIANDGNITLFYSDHKPAQTFNLLKLYKEKPGSSGMDTILSGKVIQFYVSAEKIRMIRFASRVDAADTYTAFLKLYSRIRLSMAEFNDHPSEGIYFISRNAKVNGTNSLLLNSIRPIDKKAEAGTKIDINSNGEGWLDKDSLPVGRWNFFAKDKNGKEYLFKKGTYNRTVAAMFEVKNIDSADLFKDHHLTFCTLQQEQTKRIPFIKSYAWQYYHPDGSLWKLVHYRVTRIPIITQLLMQGDDQPPVLIVEENETPDEWINTRTGDEVEN